MPFPDFELYDENTLIIDKEATERSLQAFTEKLAEQTTIRVYVDKAPRYGNQASSINLVRRLVESSDGPWKGFGYAGYVEICYETDEVLNKIRALLPELARFDKRPYENVILVDMKTIKEQVEFGFTCARDDFKDSLPQLKVNWFLMLQPFKWNDEGNILQRYGSERADFRLDDEDTTGYNLFIEERAYRLPIVKLTEEDWIYYQTDPKFSEVERKAITLLKTITTEANLARISLGVAYGINNPHQGYAFDLPIEQRIVLAMAGLRSALEDPSANIKPPLLINFGEYNPNLTDGTSFADIHALLQGAYTLREQQKAFSSWNEQVIAQQNRARRLQSFTFPQLEQIYRLVNYMQTNGQPVNIPEQLEWLTTVNTKRVLFLQLRFVPPPVFAHMLNIVTLPAIFEGSNTAGVALNIGKPYFNVSRDRAVNNYPGENLRSKLEPIAEMRRLQTIANQIQAKLEEWPIKAEEAPNTIIGNFIKEIQPPDNNYNKYFKSIRDFYQDVLNDKFSVGLMLLSNSVAAAEAVKTNPLDWLYLLLKRFVDEQKSIPFLADVFPAGYIHQFYTALLPSPDSSLLITQPSVEAVYKDGLLTSVMLTGSTLAFDQPTEAVFVFTAPLGAIVSNATFTATSSWSLDGIPWIVFEHPFLQAIAIDALYPPSSTIGGILQGTDIELRMTFPTLNGRMVVHGEFAEAKTLSDFFALAGGLDLLRAIPEPLQALGGLGVKYVEFVYNTEALTIEYISFLIQAGEAWQFFGERLSLEDLQVLVSVTNPIVLDPQQPDSRQISAVFQGTLRIGTELDAPRIEVAAIVPELVLRGQLLEAALPLDALVRIFWADASLPWPGDRAPAITEFAFSYTMISREFELSLKLDLQSWPITIAGSEILAITSLSLFLLVGGDSTFGSLSGSLIVLPGKANIGLLLISTYTGNGWRFEGRQTSGEIALADLLASYLQWTSPPSFQLNIDGLELTIETATDSFEFAGKVKGKWNPPLQDGITFSSDLRARIGYNGGSETLGPDLVRVGRAQMPLLLAEDGSPVLLPPGGGAKQPGWFGEVSLDLIWNGIELTLFYNFDPTYQVFGITWGIFTGRIEEKEIAGQKHQIAMLQFTETTTLGSMVETMVSWLTGSKFALAAPWSTLNSVNLNRLVLVYDFTAGTVSFDVAVGPLELGIARIEAISLSYRSDAAKPGEDGVIITLKGSFLWQSDPEEPLSWDAARPETTQGPPGEGNKYLELRLLALGQHVKVDGLVEAKSVEQVIEVMRRLPLPEPGEQPPVRLDATSSWLIGADFGVLRLPEGDKGEYLLTLQIVFNDPHLYGLRLALAGKAAKLLNGLDFQILYRQVSEMLGVYQAEITLPTEMRRLSIGAYTITLPIFGIALYTNGDFQIDLGFPWNADFSRSFAIEAIIPPGIPLLGSAGLYFGKLSSAATDQLPAATNGLFQPVLVFGFGAQMGFGKSVEYGALKAGFSLTLVGILEGILAKWNPYDASTLPDLLWPQSDDTQLQGEYYFWLRGTLGVFGKLYGSIDFSIIKADVTIEINLLVQFTFESYEAIVLTILASVDVSVILQIDLGVFKINISLVFSLQVKETISIPAGGTAPWRVEGAPLPGLLRAPLATRLLALRDPVEAVVPVPNWTNLLPAAKQQELDGYLASAFTIAGDAARSPDQQEACGVVLLFIRSVPPVTQDTQTSAQKASGLLDDTSFEILCKQILRWAIASIQERQMSADEVDRQLVNDQQLLSLLNVLSTDDYSLHPTAIDRFMNTQFRFIIQLPPATGQDNATFFPLPTSLRLIVPHCQFAYIFADYNAVSSDFLAELRAYFNELAVQVQPQKEKGQKIPPAAGNAETSVASFVFGDYFLLLCRQLLQAARAALRDFTYQLVPDTTLAEILRWVNEAGDLDGKYTLTDLFMANPTHPLNPQRVLVLEDSYRINTTAETFVSIAGDLRLAFTPTDLALANAPHETLLRPGAQVRYGTQDVYTIQEGDNLLTVARYFNVRLSDLLSQAGLLDQRGLFRLPAKLLLPSLTYQVLVGDSFAGIVHQAAYGGKFSAVSLAVQNAGRSILRPGKEIAYPGQPPYTILSGDCLGDLAMQFGVPLVALLENTGILLRPDILIVTAILMIPPFATSTLPGDTLESVARRVNTTIAVLAASLDNLALPNLFAARPSPYLDLPHLPQLRVARVIEEIQRSLGLQQLSGMVSRYYLHGLRLPTRDANEKPMITPQARGMWVTEEDEEWKLPAEAGLYALTGQQFPLPAEDTKAFALYLQRLASQPWLLFAGGANELALSFDANSPDLRRLHFLRLYARDNRLPDELIELGRPKLVTRAFATYPLTSSFSWQSAAPLILPYGRQPEGLSALRLWKLPVALTNLPDLSRRALNPRFRVRIARYDEASGATINEDLTSYGWASTVEFTLKKLPAATDSSSPALRTSYEVVGAGGSSIVLLERLLDQVGTDEDFFAHLLLGYPPEQVGDASKGIQTDAPEFVTMGIAQVNLSTETRPEGTALSTNGPTLLNSRSEFLRLLWEASITRAGGFYLYYYDAEGRRGLPERIFNDKGEATVTLIVLYSQPLALADQDRLTDFMNALATAEAFETAQSVVFAEANPVPPVPPIISRPDDTLAGLAYRYYGSVAELAHENADVPLNPSSVVTISQGIYVVSPTGAAPGGNLAQIAASFGTTVQAIRSANPRITSWPDPLPTFLSIRLPRIQVQVGNNPGFNTLGRLAGLYGEALSALAAENQATPGLFATQQPLVIAGGPVVSGSDVPAGVLAIETSRRVPGAIPDDPGHQDYGKLFLQHMYTLLSYQVSENAEFSLSPLALPAGPATETLPGMPGKRRVPKTLAPGDLWHYRQALPYPKFVKQVYQKVEGLPDPAESPYRALGRLLQLNYAWQDLYGNRLLTTLSNPLPGDQGPFNLKPYLTGYTDLLIGLSQWPSVASGWQVLPGNSGTLPRLELLLSFDDSPYQGLLSASAGNATTLLAYFTSRLDPQTAVALANYRVDQNISILSATLLDDQETVRLTVSPLSAGKVYALTIANIETFAKDLTLSGSASFGYPDEPSQHASSVQDQSEQDLAIYTQLYYQLSDPNGMALTIQTSLLKDETLALPNPEKLLAWIGTIYAFLADRAQAENKVAVPESEYRVSSDVDPSRLNEDQVFKLTLALCITRNGGGVASDLASVEGLRQVSTSIAPLTEYIEETDRTLGLTLFARRFQEALSVEGMYRLKVATGVDRFGLSPSQAGSALWAVRLGLSAADTTGIFYTIKDFSAPTLFAPRPVSNHLEGQYHVPIFDYISGRGINFTVPTRFIDFAAIDIDLWVRQLFAAVDGVLTPEFTAAIQIVDQRTQKTFLIALLAFKKQLASLASKWMIPVFADQQDVEKEAIQRIFEQQMLQQLGNAYTTRAGIQFQADVRADIQKHQEALEPGQLLGTIIQNGPPEDIQSNISLTSPKLLLQTGENHPLAFLLTAPEGLTNAEGQVVPNLPLDLTYRGSQIEHQIGSLPGIENYLASSWLNFVLPETGRPLEATLGRFSVPLLLRSYPDSPAMVEQMGTSSDAPGETLDHFTRWNYHFTYSLPFHYPQDVLYGEVHFNIRDTRQGDFLAVFQHLAEFITVFPDVNKDLRGVLATIDANTTDPKVIGNAAIALMSFNQMVERIVKIAQQNGGLFRSDLSSASPARRGQLNQSYTFTIQEGCIQRDEVAALLIILRGQPPEGIAAPQVLIDPEKYDVQSFVCNGSDCEGEAIQGDFCFWYKKKDSGQPLSAVDGQRIPARQVLLKGLDLLVYQDAEASVSLRRNELPGRPVAKPFVYTTGNVAFANPFHPTIDSEAQVIDISTIGSGIPPQPITRSFEEHLRVLFATLLQQTTQPTLIVQGEIQYEYALHPGLSPVSLAILLQPPQLVKVIGQDSGSLAQMINTWLRALQNWGDHDPCVENGVLWFDLTLMSELTSQPMPLLRLRLLCLPLSTLDPPLWPPK